MDRSLGNTPVVATPRRFLVNQRGNMGTMLALAMVPIMAIVGSAVDYANALRLKAGLQNALDSAVIAGASAQAQSNNVANTQAAVANFIAAKYTNPDGSAPTVTTTVDPTGSVSAQATVEVPTLFMRFFGQSSLPMQANAQAVFGSSTAEVVIALDVTGSMAGTKIAAAQIAAQQLIDTLYSTPGAASKIRVGFVPFNYYANIGLSQRNAPWLANANDYPESYAGGCYDTFPNAVYGAPIVHNDPAYNDGVPYTYTWTEYPVISYGAPVPYCYPAGTWTHVWGGAVGSRNYPSDLQDGVSASDKVPPIFDVGDLPAEMTRLTNNPAAVKAQIAATVATGETYIPSGLLWGWRLLSPNAPFGDGAPYGTTKKILILMTDGANTRSPTYPAHDGGDTALANSITTQTCANMKAMPDVTLFTIAFDVTDPTIQGILAGCASGPPNYFNATTIAAMQTAFAQIGNTLTGVRIAR